MSFPLFILLVLYLACILFIFIYALANLYHIVRYGRFDAKSYIATGIYLGGYVIILFISFLYLAPVDWTQSVPIFGPGTFNSSPSTQF